MPTVYLIVDFSCHENEDDVSNLFSNESKHRPDLAHIEVNVSPALRGVPFILAWFVCWNHLFDANAKANNEHSWFHHEESDVLLVMWV